MNCEYAKANAVLYCYDELADDVRHELEQHMARCADCAREVDTVRALHGIMSTVEQPEPSPNLLAASRNGPSLVVAGGWKIPAPKLTASPNGDVTVGLRPEGISIGAKGQAAEVVAVEPFGSEVIVDVRIGDQALKVRAAPDVRPDPGSTVNLRADPDSVRVFDRESGVALN